MKQKDSFDLDPHSVSEYDAHNKNIQKAFADSLKQNDESKLADKAEEEETNRKSKEVEEIKKTSSMSTEQAQNEQKLIDVFKTADELPEA